MDRSTRPRGSLSQSNLKTYLKPKYKITTADSGGYVTYPNNPSIIFTLLSCHTHTPFRYLPKPENPLVVQTPIHPISTTKTCILVFSFGKTKDPSAYNLPRILLRNVVIHLRAKLPREVAPMLSLPSRLSRQMLLCHSVVAIV